MILAERHKKIADYISETNFVSLGNLAKKLNISVSTARRDLESLELQGIVKRARGGAIFIGERDSSLSAYRDRQILQIKEKRAIGKRAAELVNDGDTILIDNGTTSYQVALNLKNKDIQVVTNSLQISLLYANQKNIHLANTGGELYPGTGSYLGPYTKAMLRGIKVQKAFIGTSGITEDGFYNSNAIVVDTERAMMDCATDVYIVSDSSKYGKSSLALLCDFSSVTALVTEALPEEGSLLDEEIKSEKLKVILAKL
jgi:DeoR/GlpR family transcriptional regulator of sugar metabolism